MLLYMPPSGARQISSLCRAGQLSPNELPSVCQNFRAGPPVHFDESFGEESAAGCACHELMVRDGGDRFKLRFVTSIFADPHS